MAARYGRGNGKHQWSKTEGSVNNRRSAGISLAGASNAALNACHCLSGRIKRVCSASTDSAAFCEERRIKPVKESFRSLAAVRNNCLTVVSMRKFKRVDADFVFTLRCAIVLTLCVH